MSDFNFSKLKIDTLLGSLKGKMQHNAQAEVDVLFQQIDDELNGIFHAISDFRHALDSSIIMAVTNPKGMIEYANRKFCEISQYTTEELIGQDHRILNSGYHDKSFFRKMWKTIKSGKTWNEEVRNRAKDGSYYWVKTTIVPIKDEQGKVTRYLSFRTDITKGKVAEERLREALKNDFTRTVSALHNFVFKLRKREDGVFLYSLFEGKLAKEIGLTTRNTYGKSPKDIFPRETGELLEKNYHRAFTGEKVTYSYSFKDREFLTTLSPIIQQGKVVEIIGSTSEITELRNAERTIRHMAYHDPLTGLPNRRMFIEEITAAISREKRSKTKTALLFLDLDRFKQINDTIGHTIGDQLLISIGHRLQQVVKDDGKVYRLGDDEFVILLHNMASRSQIDTAAEKILDMFKSPFSIQQFEFFITSSIGISYYPCDGLDSETLMKNADTAMHYAKKSGRNTYRFYSHKMNEKYREQLKIETELRKALKNDELELYYQPKIDITTGKMVGAEALLRWNHPSEGFISPGRFIPIAEETGLVISIGEWVLHNACQQNKKWLDKGYQPILVAVNVSALQFQQPNFIDIVDSVLELTQLNPAYLELEITENSVMGDIEESIQTLHQLRDRGISIAIDDFGTGYSSLNYLKRFPITSLKIDQSFVRDIMTDKGDAAIVRAVINLAHNINLKVVAEGVEEQKILQFLQEHKCDEVQGYYFSKPLPVEQFEQVLVRNVWQG
ncbi:EAL domain-containing protein [Aneurinibacillus sp. Ricciae_BoGa-3]|uniref:sensor domain-containing protein n=1 Tax=Aneurinibacillus sp. Ricciae_BoGa-3 TaxID=3022697 RepID=UPI0023413A46|nr:EAL domain-containing protein [Aneurinibacillus sp. Ricciae_BoGa-3]WCK52645.1 EAL domain-containing protein [Aneurinibacillus sp. Ricciae_BoGa-3]